jgi:hypothetical protein
VLEHVFQPFLACCADAVMLSKRNVAIDDDDGVMAMTMRFVRMWALKFAMVSYHIILHHIISYYIVSYDVMFYIILH